MALGGLAGTSQSWINLGFGWNPADRLPDSKAKGVLDNWTILCGPNDRTTLMGPNLISNIGSGYSTSFDLVGYLISKMAGPEAGAFGLKSVMKLMFGYGDIKLAFGPSTSLLYGGPGGSSKRGPYWDRIAGTWENAWAKGSLVSAEGSFMPKAIGKQTDSLQFFERKQIFGEENTDGRNLGIQVQAGFKVKKTKGADQEELLEQQIDVYTAEPFTDWKKDKYENDMAVLFTTTEKQILEKGDSAARWGMIAIFIVDACVATLFIVYAIQNKQGSQVSTDDQMKKVATNNKNRNDLETKKNKASADSELAKNKYQAAEKILNDKEVEKKDAGNEVLAKTQAMNIAANARKSSEKSKTDKENKYIEKKKEREAWERNTEEQTKDPDYEGKLDRLKKDEEKLLLESKDANLDFETKKQSEEQAKNNLEKANKDKAACDKEYDKAKAAKTAAEAEKGNAEALENDTKNQIGDPMSSERERRDLRWNRTLLVSRAVYKTLKILILTIMETLENVEMLARSGVEVKNLAEINLDSYVENTYLKTEKKLKQDLAKKAIEKSVEDQAKKTEDQIKKIVDQVVNQIK